jgi:hypothetical protein
MNWWGVLRVYFGLRFEGGRNVRELDLYTTDDLRHLYQADGDAPIRLRDGIVSRVELVAVIRWRVLRDAFGLAFVLLLSFVAAAAAVIAAVEGWHF